MTDLGNAILALALVAGKIIGHFLAPSTGLTTSQWEDKLGVKEIYVRAYMKAAQRKNK